MQSYKLNTVHLDYPANRIKQAAKHSTNWNSSLFAKFGILAILFFVSILILDFKLFRQQKKKREDTWYISSNIDISCTYLKSTPGNISPAERRLWIHTGLDFKNKRTNDTDRTKTGQAITDVLTLKSVNY